MYYAASWMRQPIPRYGGHMLTCRESQSRPQKPRSFRSAPRIQTAGLVGKPSKTMAKSDWLLKIRSFHIQSLAHAHIQFLVPVCESPRAVKCSVNAADSYPVASRIPNLVSLAVHLGKDNSSFPSAIARVNWRSQTQRFFFFKNKLWRLGTTLSPLAEYAALGTRLRESQLAGGCPPVRNSSLVLLRSFFTHYIGPFLDHFNRTLLKKVFQARPFW